MQIDAWFEAWAAAQMPLQGEDDTQPDPDGLLLDLGQFVLDIAGIIGPSPLCDGVKAIISLVRLDFLGAGCSALGILAFAGDFAKLGKLPKYIESAFQALRLAAKTPDFAAKVAPLVRAIKNLLDKLPLEKLPKQISGRLVELRDGIAEFLPQKVRFGLQESICRVHIMSLRILNFSQGELLPKCVRQSAIAWDGFMTSC
ncbi:MAG TPA: hypothetical protein EYH34_07835, partial [Planctomycetes bacterium]|nr:hypothetical protein [Planctomycetota bacterium]